MPSKTVDANKSGQVLPPSPLKRLVAQLELEAQIDNTYDTEGFVESILEKQIEAATLEDLVEAQNAGSTGGRDLIDVELEVRHFYVVKASNKFKTMLGHYVIADDVVRLDTLQQSPFNTGAPNLVLFLWKARSTDRLPVQFTIRARETENGTLLTAELLPKRPMDAEPSY